MDPLETTVILTRWVHLVATVVWVGGNLFFLFVLRPALRSARDAPPELSRLVGTRFKEAVDLSMWVLVITGGVLIYDRLTDRIEAPYLVTLTVKLTLSTVMFLVAMSLGRQGGRRQSSPLEGSWTEIIPAWVERAFMTLRLGWAAVASPTNVLAVLGPVIVFLGVMLRVIA
ncbi:MAG: hypothetical protein QF652_02155 [Dehalococcoidia bacterium]|jgi:uncharacterized membrane protein|nr:hypothetical protein [Dehalococcoidia bacterium]